MSHAAFISIVVHFIFFATQPFGLLDKPLAQEKKYKKIRLEVIKKPEVVRVPQKKLEVKRPVLHKKSVLPKPVAIPVSSPIKQTESIPMQVTRPIVVPVTSKALESFEVSTLSKISELENSRRNAGGHSTLVDIPSVANHSIKPQLRNVVAIQDQLSDEELNELSNGYTTKVRQMIARAKIYPPEARKKEQQGKIGLSFKLGKDGRVFDLLVEHSSGHVMLDEAARNSVKDAAPFPPIPEKLNKQDILLRLSVSFILR